MQLLIVAVRSLESVAGGRGGLQPLEDEHRVVRLELGELRHTGHDDAPLHRRCRRIVWLNPMLGWAGYEPVARGMADALPHVDLFAPAPHNLENLTRLEGYLAKL